MVTQMTKEIAAKAIDVVHEQRVTARAYRMLELQRLLITVGQTGTSETVMEIAELIAESPKVGASSDWWDPCR